MNIEQALAEIRRQADGDIGQLEALYVRLVRHFLRSMPGAANERVDEVLLRDDGDDRRLTDAGIDLIVRASVDGRQEHWAVQARYRATGNHVTLADVNALLAASKRAGQPFTRLYLATTVEFSDQAHDRFCQQSLPTTIIDLARMGQVDYAAHFDMSAAPHEPQELRPHQRKALKDVLDGLRDHDRGRLVMASGTGKTLASLRMAEQVCGPGKAVLVLVPSIAQLHQSILEWTTNRWRELAVYAVCADSGAGTGERAAEILQVPADTDPARLADRLKVPLPDDPMRVVFATYHSLDVVKAAQDEHGVAEFDLCICDDAHHTATNAPARDLAACPAIHDPAGLQARKRLYMTATPVIHGASAKSLADGKDLPLCSMDDDAVFGPEFHRLDFSQALEQDLLSDYRLCVYLMKPSDHAPLLEGKGDNAAVTDTLLAIGTWCGLSRISAAGDDGVAAAEPAMQRAVVFTDKARQSRLPEKDFAQVVEACRETMLADDAAGTDIEMRHVDGTLNTSNRAARLAWLRKEPEPGVCRVITTASRLPGGAGVPALDAVVFLGTGGSPVDIVQALGKVMRKVEGKRTGRIIIPLVLPESVDTSAGIIELSRHQALRPIIQVAAALKAHDSTFCTRIDELVRVFSPPRCRRGRGTGPATRAMGQAGPPHHGKQLPLAFELEHKIHAAVIKEFGDRRHWPVWAGDVGHIVARIIGAIKQAVSPDNPPARREFKQLVREIRQTLSPSVTDTQVMEMLAQHVVTRPLFDAAFQDSAFTARNKTSRAIDAFVALLGPAGYRHHLQPLDPFYRSVKAQFAKHRSLEARQRIMADLYETFFHKAFAQETARHGVVYTPIEIVDFIVRGTDHLLRTEFGVAGLTGKDVNILDPFTGTGTFLVRLLQGDLVRDADLARKYGQEMHANEIMLLPYYIASINIEEAYHARRAGHAYLPFPGLALTDTFRDMARAHGGDLFTSRPGDRGDDGRRATGGIRVILGNPPYSVGQKSQNDDNQNTSHADLARRIRATYVRQSSARVTKALHDSYVKAFRWASDHLGDNGVIAFISNGSFLDSRTADGMRKCLATEFHKVHCFNLRGNQRTVAHQASMRHLEGDSVFGQGTMTTTAITFLVKKACATTRGRIFIADIAATGALQTKDKLRVVRTRQFDKIAWQEIQPDARGDWLNQVSSEYLEYIPLEPGDGDKLSVFSFCSHGITTSRDAWVYNHSRARLEKNVRAILAEYARQRGRGKVERDHRKISWSASLLALHAKQASLDYNPGAVRRSANRPFVTKWLYFDEHLVECLHSWRPWLAADRPTGPVLCVSSSPVLNAYSALMTDTVPCSDYLLGTRCFPYRIPVADSHGLVDGGNLASRDNIPDETLAHFRQVTGLDDIEKIDIFHYVYAMVQSRSFRTRHAVELTKTRTRIPLLQDPAMFRQYVEVGARLAELHLNHETAAKYPVKANWSLAAQAMDDNDARKHQVGTMKLIVPDDPGLPLSIRYNEHLTLTGIPPEVRHYMVGGKMALEWVVNRHSTKVDRKSGLVDNPNEALPAMAAGGRHGRHVLDVLRRVITVSLRTQDILRELPQIGGRRQPNIMAGWATGSATGDDMPSMILRDYIHM